MTKPSFATRSSLSSDHASQSRLQLTRQHCMDVSLNLEGTEPYTALEATTRILY